MLVANNRWTTFLLKIMFATIATPVSFLNCMLLILTSTLRERIYLIYFSLIGKSYMRYCLIAAITQLWYRIFTVYEQSFSTLTVGSTGWPHKSFFCFTHLECAHWVVMNYYKLDNHSMKSVDKWNFSKTKDNNTSAWYLVIRITSHSNVVVSSYQRMTIPSVIKIMNAFIDRGV